MHVRRRLGALVAALGIATLMVVGVAPSAASAAPARRPVVLVYGWNGSTSTWNAAVSRFTASGFARSSIFIFSYNSTQSNTTTASQLATYVQQVRAQTGASTVDLVSH